MKKTMLTLIVFAIVVGAKAQDIPERKMDRAGMHRMHGRPGMEGRHRRMMDGKDLNLTDQQKEQFRKGREDFRTKFEALQKEDNITVKEYRSRMEKLRNDQKAFRESILSPEQKTQIERKKEDIKYHRGEMMNRRDAMMKDRLGLTTEQSTQIKKNREDMQERIKAIREDKSLSTDKQREAIRNEMKAHHEKMSSILTEEQKNKMKEMKDRKGDFKGRRGPGPDKKRVI